MPHILTRASALRAPARGRRSPAGSAAALGPTLQIVDADGDVLSARAVPLAGASEHTLALTRDGYVLLDAEGRVIHQL